MFEILNMAPRIKFLLTSNILFLIIFFGANAVNGACLDKPQLFLHKRDGIHQVLEHEPYVTIKDPNKEYLSCRSSQNLEWHYAGEGEPSKFQETTSVEIAQEDGSLEYCSTSKISFYPKQSDTDLAKHTGRYVCQDIGNSSNKVSAYVFTGRRNAPTFLHSRKTISMHLSSENITNQAFNIPCVTSTGSVNVTLLRRIQPGSSKFKVVSSSSSADSKFDPRSGFRVDVPNDIANLSSFYGEWKCISKHSGSSGKRVNVNVNDDFVIYNLIKPPSFRVYPSENLVLTSTTLNLTCESTEESVILKEVKIRSASVHADYGYDEDQETDDDDDNPNSNSVEDIIETVENTEHKLHVANYLDINPEPESFGEFQCLSEKDKRVLHSWRYRILSKKEEKLSGIKFDKRDNSFSCRAKSGMPGKLSFVSCRTPSECRINGICLERAEGCRGYSNATKALCHRGNHFCGKIFYKGGSGLIRCIGEGTDQIRGFTDEANDLRLRMGFHKLKPSETAFMSLVTPIDDKSSFLEGEHIEINLSLGYYHFVQPVQWAIKLRNGSSLDLTPEAEIVQENKLHRVIQAKLRLPFTTATTGDEIGVGESRGESNIVGINALIPLRSSVPPSWKTITMPIRVHVVGKSSGVNLISLPSC